MSNKHSNRPSGCHGHSNGHFSRGDRNQTHTPKPGPVKERVRDILNDMDREMTLAAKDISEAVVDVFVPLIVAAAVLPDMDMRINGLRVSHNERRTIISFHHPGKDDDEDADYDDDDEQLYRYED